MVRHEAAEALGGIATPEVLPHLKEWMTREDSPRVVRESCQVAIDMWEVGIKNIVGLGSLLIYCLASTKTRINSNMQMDWMMPERHSPLQCNSTVDLD